MINYESFRFKNKNTLIHNLDPRIKIVIVLSLSISLLFAEFLEIGILGIFIVLMGVLGKVNLFKKFRETKLLLVLLLFIFLIHCFSTPGETSLSIWKISISIQGVKEGIKIASRLILIIAIGFIYTDSTPPEKTKATIEWFLSPFPINEKILGSSADIGIRFIPLMAKETERMNRAEKSRSLDKSNILRRLKYMLLPLIIRAINRAERLTKALRTRLYRAEKSSSIKLEYKPSGYSILFTITSVLLSILIFLKTTI